MRLLTRFEAAEALAVSVRTLDRLVAQGALPVVRPSPGARTVRIPEAALDTYIARSTSGEPLPARRRNAARHLRLVPSRSPGGPERLYALPDPLTPL